MSQRTLGDVMELRQQIRRNAQVGRIVAPLLVVLGADEVAHRRLVSALRDAMAAITRFSVALDARHTNGGDDA